MTALHRRLARIEARHRSRPDPAAKARAAVDDLTRELDRLSRAWEGHPPPDPVAMAARLRADLETLGPPDPDDPAQTALVKITGALLAHAETAAG